MILIALGYFIYNKSMVPKTEIIPVDTASQGKLNIDVVCQGALSYMTFENQVEADKFVQECKEGKRPEVIERYKQQMNLGDGATI